MVILPPILVIVGIVLSRQMKQKGDNGPKSLHLTPDVYLKPGSEESYATLALLQNATTHAIGYIIEYFTDYKVGTELVSNVGGVLNSSLSQVYNLGFILRQFPAASNLSQSGVSISYISKMAYCCAEILGAPRGKQFMSFQKQTHAFH